MRPDRLVVGEVRGAEVTELLAALNTGREGGCLAKHTCVHLVVSEVARDGAVRSYPPTMEWSSVVSTVTGAVIGVGATWLADRSRWSREQGVNRTNVRRELYAAYLAAVAQTWNEIHAATINSTEPWPERASQAAHAYRNGGMYELRYQVSITAPPEIVALSDTVLRGMRDLVESLVAGQTYDSWAELKEANRAWFEAFDTMWGKMRLDLDPASLPLPPSAP